MTTPRQPRQVAPPNCSSSAALPRGRDNAICPTKPVKRFATHHTAALLRGHDNDIGERTATTKVHSQTATMRRGMTTNTSGVSAASMSQRLFPTKRAWQRWMAQNEDHAVELAKPSHATRAWQLDVPVVPT